MFYESATTACMCISLTAEPHSSSMRPNNDYSKIVNSGDTFSERLSPRNFSIFNIIRHASAQTPTYLWRYVVVKSIASKIVLHRIILQSVITKKSKRGHYYPGLSNSEEIQRPRAIWSLRRLGEGSEMHGIRVYLESYVKHLSPIRPILNWEALV